MHLKSAIVAALVIVPCAGMAQAPAPGVAVPSVPVVTPRDPLSVPGDNLPPSAAQAAAPPSPAAPRPPAPPQAPGPQLDVALAAAQAALAKCTADGLKVGVAVTNQQGVVVAALRMDGAPPQAAFNGIRKSLAAVAYGVPTSEVQARLRAGDFATLVRARPNMMPVGGAVPLRSGGLVIGAIGVSGATSLQDEVCAKAGADAVAARL